MEPVPGSSQVAPYCDDLIRGRGAYMRYHVDYYTPALSTIG